MRISISFASPSDKARFEIELKRDIENAIEYKYHSVIDASVFKIYGIEVRVL